LLFQATHIFGLGVEQFIVPAQDISEEMLEDFAKALIGQPSQIKRYRVAGAQPGAR
jgi:hypothetical protein